MMTDNDAHSLRKLIARYGLRAVFIEFHHIAKAYAEQSPKLQPALKALNHLRLELRLFP